MSSKRLTLSLPPDVWDALDARATRAGHKIGKYVQDLLTATARDGGDGDSSIPAVAPPTKQEWAHFAVWMQANGLTPERIKAETGIKSRRSAIEWAKTKGYEA